MRLTLIDKLIWLAGFVGQLLLLWVLVCRKRTQRFPFFTAFVAFEIAETIVDFVVYRTGNQRLYFWTYWSLALVDTMLQLCLVYELAREVLRPIGRWASGTRAVFLSLGLVGGLAAAALSFAVDPQATRGLFAWSIRFDLFTTLLIAELVIVMFITAHRVGLQWSNWVMGMAEGLGIWVCISLLVETAHSHWGWTRNYIVLDNVRMVAFVIALGYWCVCLWREEPERKALSPDMQNYLAAIQHSLEYDLHNVQPTRKKR